MKQNTTSEMLGEIFESNLKIESERLKGFVKTHDEKCCTFMAAGGMFFCSETTTCKYFQDIVMPKISH